MPSYRRAILRRTVTLRVDFMTAHGWVGLGLVRNLSLQGMYIENASRQLAHRAARGDILTVAFVLPTRRACKLPAVVVHSDRHGCGVQFRQGAAPHALTNLARYWAALD